MFINRVEEMKVLDEVAGSNRSELVLMYGRRRVGKSSLLTKFAQKVGGTYFLADASKNILEIFSSQVEDEFVNFSNWEVFFDYILRSDKKVFIIDEFQYIYNNNKAWPTILQRWWEKIKDANKKIILCGSIISTIDRIARGYGSALYGRKTREMEIQPLNITDSFEMLDKMSLKDKLLAYSWVGGVPRYIEEIDTTMDLRWNLEHRIVEKTSFLYNEPMNLLFEEFRDPAPYVSILLSLINGKTRFTEISEFSHIETTRLPKYITTLQRVKIIEKDIPITDKRERSKNTRYRIKDLFFRFWLRFVFPNRSKIETGRIDHVVNSIMAEMDDYMGKATEDVIIDLVKGTAGPGWNVGKWWKKEMEVDLLAINKRSKKAVVGEIKWNPEKLDTGIVKTLRERTEYLDQIKGYDIELVLISKEIGEEKMIDGARVIDMIDLILGNDRVLT